MPGCPVPLRRRPCPCVAGPSRRTRRWRPMRPLRPLRTLAAAPLVPVDNRPAPPFMGAAPLLANSWSRSVADAVGIHQGEPGSVSSAGRRRRSSRWGGEGAESNGLVPPKTRGWAWPGAAREAAAVVAVATVGTLDRTTVVNVNIRTKFQHQSSHYFPHMMNYSCITKAQSMLIDFYVRLSSLHFCQPCLIRGPRRGWPFHGHLDRPEAPITGGIRWVTWLDGVRQGFKGDAGDGNGCREGRRHPRPSRPTSRRGTRRGRAP